LAVIMLNCMPKLVVLTSATTAFVIQDFEKK
jgi:hypothetical protein